MITYEQILKVNAEMNPIDLKGKKYAMVPDRVKAFRKLFPEGFITTGIVSHENNIICMKAECGYYTEDGRKIVLGDGLAFEEKGKGLVNGTSYIENCQTSAVGRALGFLALGVDGGGICSAEELVNAIKAQDQKKAEQEQENETVRRQNRQNPNVVKAVPPADKSVAEAFGDCMNDFMERFSISDSQEALKRFNGFRDSLRQGGVITGGDKMKTAEEVAATFDAIYKNFTPSGVMVK